MSAAENQMSDPVATIPVVTVVPVVSVATPVVTESHIETNNDLTNTAGADAPKRRGRKPKGLTRTAPHSDMLQKQSVKPQENVVLYLKTVLTPAQKQKIKEYNPGRNF
jgi:hypothetical protein